MFRGSVVTVNTAKVTGRRKVRYDSYDDLLRDAERLAAGKVRPLGNWSYAQVLEHLSRAMNAAIDAPISRSLGSFGLVAKLFFKSRALKGPMTAGFKLPADAAKALVPEQSLDNEAALAMLRQAVHRLTHGHAPRAQRGVRRVESRRMGQVASPTRRNAHELSAAGIRSQRQGCLSSLSALHIDNA